MSTMTCGIIQGSEHASKAIQVRGHLMGLFRGHQIMVIPYACLCAEVASAGRRAVLWAQR